MGKISAEICDSCIVNFIQCNTYLRKKFDYCDICKQTILKAAIKEYTNRKINATKP